MRVSNTVRGAAALSWVSGALAVNWTSTSSPLLSNGNVDLGIADAAYQKAKAFVASMTNDQKVQVITGQSVSGNVTWNAMTTGDGGNGINMKFFVTGFTSANALGMTWNTDLISAQYKALGEEFYSYGINLDAGPVSAPLGRTAWGGRVFESFSTDPYLAGIALGKAIAATAEAGIVSSARHFILNEQETNRMGGGYSANVDNKTMHEVYLWPFADAVNNGLMAVMCAMNAVNGERSCENDAILNGYLKTDLGFPGLVYPDVGGQTDSYTSANSGLDYGSSQYWSSAIVTAGVANGSFPQSRLDDMAIRNVLGYFYTGLDNGDQPSAPSTGMRDVRANHSAIVKQVSREAIILLKNNNEDGRGLPLNKPDTIAVFGAHAGPGLAGPNSAFSVGGTPDVLAGHLASGGGSGAISLSNLVSPYEAINARAIADGSMTWYILNDTYTASFSGGIPGGGGFGDGAGGDGAGGNGTFPGGGTGNGTIPGGGNTGNGTFPGGNGTFPGGGGGGDGGGFGGGGGGFGFGGGATTGSTASFTTYSDNAAVCLVFINAWSGEGADRTELANADQDTMILSVAENCNNTIVVANVVAARVLDAWIENENITAVLYSGLLGQDSGNAITDVLYGDVNPSGKLTYTIAKNASDYIPICETSQCDFTEGVYLDYRYYDANNVSVRYPFGYGLSYTTFTYGEATLEVTNTTAVESSTPTGALGLGGPADLWDEVISVSLSISNTGDVDGSEVAQLYLTFPDEASQPIRVLRGFSKVAIPAGGSGDATFSLRRRDISYFDESTYAWVIASGDYTVSIGASSQDIRQTATFTI